MRRFLIGLLFAAACCGGAQKPPAPEPVKDDERAVLIHHWCGDSEWLGTGYIMDDQSIATAAHVVTCQGAPADKVQIDFRGLHLTPEEVVALPEIDVAALRFGSDYPPVTLGVAEPGEQVCYFPAAPTRGQKCGFVITVDGGLGGLMFFPAAEHGNSGSVLFNQKGEAVGILQAIDNLFTYGFAFQDL